MSAEKSSIKKFFLVTLLMINILVGICTVFAAFGGTINPDKLHGIGSIAAMTFPFWIVAVALLLVVDLFSKRIFSIIPLAIMFICIKPFFYFCPLNLPKKPNPNLGETFSLMSYNIFHCVNFKTGEISEKSIETVLRANPEILAIQEGTVPQLNEISDSLFSLYPYRFSGTESLLSKFKVISHTKLNLPDESADLFRYVVSVNNSDSIAIYNVHLQSIGLDDHDKQTYIEITNGNARRNMGVLRHSILAKLVQAFKKRSMQAEMIRQYINNDPCQNLIVCGDFNDIPGCYAMRTIMGNDLRNAYTDCGFGPATTYRANRFYFHIDHVLYRGNMKPLSARIIRGGDSDHYPIMINFQLTP